MDSDEERSLGSRMATVPFQDCQRILGDEQPPVPGETATVPAGLPREVDNRNVVLSLSGRGEEEVEHSVVAREGHETSGVQTDLSLVSARPAPGGSKRRARANEQSNDRVSIHNILGSGLSCASEDSLEPALTIGLNPRTVNDDNTVLTASSGSIQGSINRSASAASGINKMDRDVIITGGEAGEMSTVNPTPLGRPRRASLFERANSTSVLFGALDSERGRSGEFERASSGRSAASESNASMKRADSACGENGDMGINSGALSPGGGRYNTVLRDWLMHVLEKDDQHDAQARLCVYTYFQVLDLSPAFVLRRIRRTSNVNCLGYEYDYKKYADIPEGTKEPPWRLSPRDVKGR